LLANRLDRDTWWAVADAYNAIVDWNDLIKADEGLARRREGIAAQHPMVWAMAVRAVALLGPGVADGLALEGRSLTVPAPPNPQIDET
jgi:hypothetical protein